MSEQGGRSLPRNSSQETRIKLLSNFQESYLSDKRSEEDMRSSVNEDNLELKFKEQTFASLREEVKQVEILIQYQKEINKFLLQQLGREGKALPKMEKVREVASEFLSSAAKYASDMMELQQQLDK